MWNKQWKAHAKIRDDWPDDRPLRPPVPLRKPIEDPGYWETVSKGEQPNVAIPLNRTVLIPAPARTMQAPAQDAGPINDTPLGRLPKQGMDRDDLSIYRMRRDMAYGCPYNKDDHKYSQLQMLRTESCRDAPGSTPKQNKLYLMSHINIISLLEYYGLLNDVGVVSP